MESLLQGWLAVWHYVMADITIVCTMVFACLLISLPEKCLKDTNSSYAFNDRGYYEQYGEQYEQDNGLTYYVETEGSAEK